MHATLSLSADGVAWCLLVVPSTQYDAISSLSPFLLAWLVSHFEERERERERERGPSSVSRITHPPDGNYRLQPQMGYRPC